MSVDELQEVEAALADGDAQGAFQRLRPLLAGSGRVDLGAALSLLGRIAAALEDEPLVELLGEAEPRLHDPGWLYQVGYQLIERDLPDCAATVLELAHGLAPDDPEVLTELVAALERCLRFRDACEVLRGRPGLLATAFMPRYLLGFNAVMSGDLPGLREALDGLDALEQADYHPVMTARLRRMLGRAERLAPCAPLDATDLRGWHHVITGGLLTHLSPYGLEGPMHGRYAWLQDSLTTCRLGLERLELVLQAWGLRPPCVFLLEERGAEVLARAASARLGLPLVPWGREGHPGPGLLVAYDLTLLGRGTLELLATRRPGQVLWAHAVCWTEDFPFAADVCTLLYQANRPPWAAQLRVEQETREVSEGPEDARSAEELAGALLASAVPEEDDPAADRETLRALAVAAGPPPEVEERRERMWVGSPVSSNRFA